MKHGINLQIYESLHQIINSITNKEKKYLFLKKGKCMLAA